MTPTCVDNQLVQNTCFRYDPVSTGQTFRSSRVHVVRSRKEKKKAAEMVQEWDGPGVGWSRGGMVQGSDGPGVSRSRDQTVQG